MRVDDRRRVSEGSSLCLPGCGLPQAGKGWNLRLHVHETLACNELVALIRRRRT